MKNLHLTKEQLAAFHVHLQFQEEDVLFALYTLQSVFKKAHEDAKAVESVCVHQLLLMTRGGPLHLHFPDVSEKELLELFPKAQVVNGIG